MTSQTIKYAMEPYPFLRLAASPFTYLSEYILLEPAPCCEEAKATLRQVPDMEEQGPQ